MIIIILTIFAALAALVGGYVAIRSRNYLDVALAITSGMVLGLVAFDLLPEIFEGLNNSSLSSVWPMALFVTGFLLFHFVERFILLHGGNEHEYGPHHHPKLGIIRALALAGHSFLDGLSIGIAFQVSSAVGVAVALAVIGHRFADGFDTANYMLLHKNSAKQIKQLLPLVIMAPILGGLTSLFISLSESALTLYLGLFAGVLMYMAASNILPQAHAKGSTYKSIALVIVGVIFIVVLTRFI